MLVHANAPWTPKRRRELIGRVESKELSVEEAAQLGGVSQRTVYRWLARRRAGDDLLEDRASKPHNLPHATPPERVEILARLRRQRWTVPQLGDALGMPYSTVTAVLTRLGLNRLGALQPPPPPNRYERRHAGELIHLDVKKLARFERPGHRVHGDRRRNTPNAGWEYLHVAVDDATRLAYAEVLNEGETAVAVVDMLRRLVSWYAARGVTPTAILTDNGPGYLSRLFALACKQLGLKHLRTRPYRPRRNGKAERFIRLLLNSWAYAVVYNSSQARRHALPAWLHYYNHHRPHGSLNRTSPGQRLHVLNNAAGNYI